MPQVCRYLSSLGQLTEGKVTLGENGLLSPALSSSPESVRGAGGEGKDFGDTLSVRPRWMCSSSLAASRGCSSGLRYSARQSKSQSTPRLPVSRKTGRQSPNRLYTKSTRNGATAAPMHEPLSNNATAQA